MPALHRSMSHHRIQSIYTCYLKTQFSDLPVFCRRAALFCKDSTAQPNQSIPDQTSSSFPYSLLLHSPMAPLLKLHSILRPNLYYRAISRRELKKPPLGPSAGSVTSQTGVSAPSSGVSGAAAVPMSVCTHPGSAELTFTLEPRNSLANSAVRAFKATLEAG